MNKAAYIQGYQQKEAENIVSNTIYNTLGSGVKKREAARQAKLDADILAKRTAVQKQRSSVGNWSDAVKKYGDKWLENRPGKLVDKMRGLTDPLKKKLFAEQKRTLVPTAIRTKPPLHKTKPTVEPTHVTP